MDTKKCFAIVPVREKDIVLEDKSIMKFRDKSVLQYTIEAAKNSSHIDEVIVSTDSQIIKEEAIKLGALVPFLRPQTLSEDEVLLPEVLNFTISSLEEHNMFADVIVLLEVAHPFREAELIDQMINSLKSQNLDSIFTVAETKENYWQYDAEGKLKRVYSKNVYLHRQDKNPLYREILGLTCVTKRECIDKNNIIGENVGVVPVRDEIHQIDLLSKTGRFIADYINLWNDNK